MGSAEGLLEAILESPSRLSDNQRAAVLSKARYNRVIAGAGAGKTETLTLRIAYLLLVEAFSHPRLWRSPSRRRRLRA